MPSAGDRTRSSDTTHHGFEHPFAFWAGALACTLGVLLHLPMYVSARHMGYHMRGMEADASMIAGMVLIVLGLLAVLYGLVPRRGKEIQRESARIRIRALDDAPLRGPHIALLIVMAIAVTIDVMKPTALAFVAPGVAHEYGLKSPMNPGGDIPVSWLPLAGITGTVIGSLIWGWLGDRIGRRSSLLFAGMLFVTTSICGAMPGFTWNLVMCGLMGIGAGGMLPITFTLLAETIPARHRGWLMVLIGGDIAGAYVITSWLAAELTPTYSWRILWLIGLPTGLLFIALNRWIPESPRFLLASGRRREAEQVMAKYGAVAETDDAPEQTVRTEAGRGSYRTLLRGPLLGPTLAIGILGIGVGLMTFGFQMWVPTNLQHLGYSEVNSDYVVRNAAVLGLPLTVVAAWMYGVWGSRRTLVTVCAVTGLALLGFLVAGDSLAEDRLLLSLLLVVPLTGASTVVAVVAGYAAEVYPTLVRSHGTGLAAGMTKVGGVLILSLTVAAAAVPSIGLTAVIGAVPLLLAALLFLRVGPETKSRGLEDISQELMASRS
ncbi:MFS transporter [Streptomyces sp. R302]|uniref:MFS transporter n=1 Tax=unclassified Streptomyces TaxID=2593676 RepID=UPI00145C843D|nr:MULTISPECIES: MFS transporter [unclassified Streptomyces]NML51002.1 MFS transporter [Streptomyces sp. R301]NML81096.1 MFS transporter [Streptomyces sp. R302]